MNQYTVLKEFVDPIEGKRPVGSTVSMEPDRGAKLLKMGYVTMTDEYMKDVVQLRWVNESLEVYNKLTGVVLLRIPQTGLTSLTLDIVGNVTGDVTGNVTGDLTGNVTGDVTGNVTGDLTGQTFGQVSTYVGDGVIGITDNVAKLNGNGATCNMTLADGTEGQTMTVKAIDVTNACTLAPTNMADGATVTFTTQYAAATLFFDGTDWNVTSTYGTVTVA